MKVINNERPSGIINSIALKKSSKNSVAPEQKNAEFDQITISQSPTSQKSDEQFITYLKNQLVSEVKSGASQYKITDLSQQIALKQYDNNPADIARKILMDTEV
ncbi:hypothetical protein [Sinanaerobacter sp. ZZT-01]|uniref:hypothetical protein n=1 Tax=Sinanaerobacter sp. ZZT-01 TaxID=3111540 RepID=UPI002D7729D1|nr:hypothetical protein [Sinanaerobacter sp. ZZT-01]WRR93583.1 hypothetical protein U5921_00210 [Sinanaerobacter sp. ZZT-01]